MRLLGKVRYGPFEAGLGEDVDAGLDVRTAAYLEGNSSGTIMDAGGGHTPEYHFHERLSSLYDAENSAAEVANYGGHSRRVAEELRQSDCSTNDCSDKTNVFVYGKWEAQENGMNILPQLDACGGHFGVTPDSNCQTVYHYHVQEREPFFIGCYGPDMSSGEEKLVTIDKCRALYPEATTAGRNQQQQNVGMDEREYMVNGKTIAYKYWMPCFDGAGVNMEVNTGDPERTCTVSGGGRNLSISCAADSSSFSITQARTELDVFRSDVATQTMKDGVG